MLSVDVEGVAVARGRIGSVLVVFSQGDSTYSAYDLHGAHAFRGSFWIATNGPVGGTSDADRRAGRGNFGAAFPGGLLVAAHDADNRGVTTDQGNGSSLEFVHFGRCPPSIPGPRPTRDRPIVIHRFSAL